MVVLVACTRDGARDDPDSANERLTVAAARALETRIATDGVATHEPELQQFVALPRSRAGVRNAVAHLLAVAALDCLKRMDLTAAAGWAKQARELNDAESTAYLVLGEIEFSQTEYDAAFQLYDTGLRHNPHDAQLSALYERRKAEASDKSSAKKRSAHFTVSFEGPPDADAAQRTLAAAEDAFDEAGALYDFFPHERVPVVLYASRNYESEVRHPAWSAGSYDGKVRLAIVGSAAQPKNFRATVFHEYGHALFHRATGGTHAPPWLDEGLAEVVAQRAGPAATAVACSLGHAQPLHALERPFAGMDLRTARFAYLGSQHAVERLIERHSIKKVQQLIKELGRARDFGSAFETAFGESPETFYSVFDSEAHR
jgi:tetratricopeptide (TPR) repeat protein